MTNSSTDIETIIDAQHQQHQQQQNATPIKSKGIDLEEAMSILSTRAKDGGEKELHSSSSTTKSKFDNPQLKQMGQTIDLIASQEWTRASETKENNCKDHMDTSPLVIQEREEMAKQPHEQNENKKKEKEERVLKLKETFAKKTPSELLQALFNIQKERVLTYQKFNQGLEVVLQSSNFSQYTTLATNVTAIFVVLSNSIREIFVLFDDSNPSGSKTTGAIGSDKVSAQTRKEIAAFIKQLQSHEKEQLHLTAALHLEKMRERNEVIDLSLGMNSNGSNDDITTSAGNEKIAALLRESISSLQGKVSECIENINDVLEELRYAAAELN